MAEPYPVLEIVPEVRQKLIDHPIVILQAPPGAGKSTILPLQLLDEQWLGQKKIIMLEPRRLATRSVAMRMSSLLKEEVGERVGYRIRFESRVSLRTRIEVVTEGILTRMIQHDNALEGVALLIFDEFHERSLQADLALALALQVQQLVRDDLRILIMSATLDSQLLSDRLNHAPVISSSGKQYPVEIRYEKTDPTDKIPQQMAKAIRKALRDERGDILCFLPGAGEILRTQELLEKDGVSSIICPLFGDLSFNKQQQAILPDEMGRRKIVLATSIAETSLTIEGITTVIDSGFSRVPKFDPRSGLTRLDTIRVTRDSADQRTGRAGRLGPGVCYRLWNEATQRNLANQRKPEIIDADLAPLMLELFAWGIRDVSELTWLTAPPTGAVNQAKDLLRQLEAVDDHGITIRGKKMAELPAHPRIAHMLTSVFKSKEELALAIDVAALLEERDPLPGEISADLTLRLEVLRKFRRGEKGAGERNVLERICKAVSAWRKLLKSDELNNSVSDHEVGTLIALAYPERIAKRAEKNKERYKLTNGRVVRLPSHDPLMSEEWLAVAHLDSGTNEGKIFLAAPVLENDLHRIAQTVEIVRWNADRGTVEGVEVKQVGGLVLAEKMLTDIPDDRRMNIICQAVQSEGLHLLGWNESHTNWQARVMSIRSWRPDENWPDVSTENLVKIIAEWLPPFLTRITKRKELQQLDLHSILTSLLPWNLQQQLDKLAPQKLEVPSGSWINLSYFENGRSPVLEVRLQELFGLLETPAVNEGKIKIVIHLLSPGYKPVQVTQDLRSFWQNTYQEVRKELRRRYPKHSWPEDPWTAKAVRGAPRRKR